MSSLYQRLGAAKGIARLVDDVIEAHMINATIKARFYRIAISPNAWRN